MGSPGLLDGCHRPAMAAVAGRWGGVVSFHGALAFAALTALSLVKGWSRLAGRDAGLGAVDSVVRSVVGLPRGDCEAARSPSTGPASGAGDVSDAVPHCSRAGMRARSLAAAAALSGPGLPAPWRLRRSGPTAFDPLRCSSLADRDLAAGGCGSDVSAWSAGPALRLGLGAGKMALVSAWLASRAGRWLGARWLDVRDWPSCLSLSKTCRARAGLSCAGGGAALVDLALCDAPEAARCSRGAGGWLVSALVLGGPGGLLDERGGSRCLARSVEAGSTLLRRERAGEQAAGSACLGALAEDRRVALACRD